MGSHRPLVSECTGYNRSKSGTFKWNLPMKCTWSGAPESGALVHWCNICEINPFFSRGDHQGIHLKLNAPGTTGPNQVLLNGICL